MDEVTLSDEKRFTVIVGPGSLERLGDLVSEAGASRVAVISERRALKALSEVIEASLNGAGARYEFLLAPSGERAKTLGTALSMVRRLAGAGFTRDSLIIGVGGGSLLDLAGFVASIYMRGLGLFYIPTTTLAQVDACVGGKTGVNLGSKNVVGTFYHPDAVIVDVSILRLLPRNVYLEGFAEVVKHGVIAGDGFLSFIEGSIGGILSRDLGVLEGLVRESLKLKLSIVMRDFRERGLRVVLNLGHTVGHAMEAYTGYSLSHGRAVSIGLIAELRIAERVLGFPEKETLRVERLLRGLGLPVRASGPLTDLASYIRLDKKVSGDKIRIPLPRRLGDVRVLSVDRGVFEAWLRALGT